MYRASADDDDIAAAVVSAGQALLGLKDGSARALVEAAAKDANTVPAVQDGLALLLGGGPQK
jgi:hypothetical protein